MVINTLKIILYASTNLNVVVSLGSREEWTGLPGQGPRLRLINKERDG